MDVAHVQSRQDMIRFLDGHAWESADDAPASTITSSVVKTQLIEVQDGCSQHGALPKVFAGHGIRLDQLDDSLFRVVDRDQAPIGWLEQLSARVVGLYSVLKADDFDARVRRIIMSNRELDYVWLSGQTFGVLWKLLGKYCKPHRFTRLVFTHDSVYDIDSDAEYADEDSTPPEDTRAEDADRVFDHRATSFRLTDRLGELKEHLEKLQDIYSPFFAISQLRFPSPTGRGGHDFFDNGRVTNRSASFLDHRSHLLFVIGIYENMLRATEASAWYAIKESVNVPGQFNKIVGAPITVRFREPLSESTFSRWIQTTFSRKRNRFRLWGHPIVLGPTKVHVYGVDRHLWQPIFLEFTSTGCVAIIPHGTCGNTVHRLVTNIQRYVDPGATAFIGDKPYRDMVEDSAGSIPYVIQS